MKKFIHTIYLALMIVTTLITTVYLIYIGYTYYSTPLEERFYHPQHNWFKSSGIYGQGLGIIGTLMMFVGVTTYIVRKRYNFLSRTIRLKYLLEFHIFLCTLGPILILFHTTFKFGGVVSIAFWSMVAVVLSGVVGRFIYIQIPRSIEGRMLTLNEVQEMQMDWVYVLQDEFHFDDRLIHLVIGFADEHSGTRESRSIRKLVALLDKHHVPEKGKAYIIQMIKKERSLARKISRLQTMQQLFKYWHVVHLPFALIMLIIVVFHVGVSLAFGYKWIF